MARKERPPTGRSLPCVSGALAQRGSLHSHPADRHRFSQKFFFVHEADFKTIAGLPSRFVGLPAFMHSKVQNIQPPSVIAFTLCGGVTLGGFC
jgi:hypothetical protein